MLNDTFTRFAVVNLSRYVIATGEWFLVVAGYQSTIERPCLIVLGSGYVQLDGVLKVG